MIRVDEHQLAEVLRTVQEVLDDHLYVVPWSYVEGTAIALELVEDALVELDQLVDGSGR